MTYERDAKYYLYFAFSAAAAYELLETGCRRLTKLCRKQADSQSPAGDTSAQHNASFWCCPDRKPLKEQTVSKDSTLIDLIAYRRMKALHDQTNHGVQRLEKRPREQSS
jgi:hypothetical protein